MKIRFFSIISSFIIFLNAAYAQQTSTSPYSSFGLGESKTNSDIVISSMGGLGTSYISDFTNEANFVNPAANRNLRYTSYNIVINTDYTNAKTSNVSSDRSTTYLANLSLAFPIGTKSRVGVNLQPYTNIGYDINTDNSDVVNQKSLFKGRGGLNAFSGMYSYNISNEFSLGAKIGYVWGDLKKDQETSLQNANLISGIFNKQEYGFFDYTLGVAYRKKLTNNHLLKIGATYNIGHTIDADVNYLYSTYYYNNNNEKISMDTLNYVKGTHDAKLPSSYSIGVAYGKEHKWSLGADFKFTDQFKLKIPEDNFDYKNKYRVAVGGWYLPNINGFRSYFEKIIYRYGLYYENTGFNVNNKTIDQYGVTAGLGLPLGKSGKHDPSMLNLGIELGQRGSKSNGLIKENFVNFKVGFNFDDLWFRKRQYD